MALKGLSIRKVRNAVIPESFESNTTSSILERGRILVKQIKNIDESAVIGK